jgi:hypothetical protein
MGGEGGQPRGEGKGRPSVWGGGGRGGGGQEGQIGERTTTRVSLREKRNDTTDDSDLASNDPQPFFPHPRTEDQPLATFFGTLQISYVIWLNSPWSLFYFEKRCGIMMCDVLLEWT